MTAPPRRVAAGPARPRVVIAGRPNVGKSTLVNRIVGRRVAVVEERPGVTRDRKELDAEWAGRPFTVVDTGGWLDRGDVLDAKVSTQAERAIAEADVVLLVVDGATGLVDEDVAVGRLLQRCGHPVLVVVNKVDSERREADAWEAVGLGLGDPWPISALHGRGTGDLLDEIVSLFPDVPVPGGGSGEPTGAGARREGSEPGERTAQPTGDRTDDRPGDRTGERHGGEGAPGDRGGDDLGAGAVGPPAPADVPRVALVGRPNVGKSTLFNRLVGEDRSVTHDAPGTTRDAVDTVVSTPEGTVCFVDTAGMRRRSRTERGTEYFSVLRALEALDRADIALLVIDATAGVTHQDQRLAERIGAAGCPTLVVMNKWDLVDRDDREGILADVGDRLAFLGGAPVLRISARTGLGVHHILPAVAEAESAYHARIPTGELNRAITSLQLAHRPVGARIQYAVQGATDPPTFTLFTNGRLQPTYLRYVERSLRERFDLGPTPIKIRVRTKGAHGGGGRRR